VFWRDIIDGTTRDHGITRFTDPVTPGPVLRATRDGWRIDACPHHGPSLSISTNGTYHLAWFTGEGPEGPGVFYARSTDGGRTLSEPLRVGTPDTLGHAAVLSRGSTVYLAWKERVDSGGTSIHVSRSDDGGRTWGDGREMLRAKGSSDYPLLVARTDGAFLSWFTADEGLRLIRLPER